MKKKLSIIALILALVLCLCACGNKQAPVAAPEQPSAGTEAAATSDAAPAQSAPSAQNAQSSDTVEAPAPTATPEPTPDYNAIYDEASALFYIEDYTGAFKAMKEIDFDNGGSALVCGNADLQQLLGSCYYFGLGTKQDYSRAVKLLTAASDNGSLIAKYLLADAYMTGHGVDEVDEAAAMRLCKEFATAAASYDNEMLDGGRVLAYLADCYAKGKGIDKDEDKALDTAELALRSPSLSSFDKFDIATAFENGLYGFEDFNKSTIVFTSAKNGLLALADADNAQAQNLIGDYYYWGLGDIKQDFTTALEYYILAGNAGNADAQAKIGNIYVYGITGTYDFEKAMEWCNKAAQQGNAQAQALIGFMYQNGYGVSVNYDEAGRWYTKAANQGNAWAADRLAEVEVTNPQSAFQAHA